MVDHESWKLVQWPYEPSVKTPTYFRQFGRCKVYLRHDENFHYTCSAGPNSDWSYSGCFYNCTKINSLDEAKNALDVLMPHWSKTCNQHTDSDDITGYTRE